MTDQPLDLSALDGSRGDAELEALITSINLRAAPELARRSATRGPFVVLAGWATPTFAAAAVLAAVAVIGVIASRPGSAAPRLSGVPEELGLPTPVAEWVSEGRPPSHDDLLLAMENDL